MSSRRKKSKKDSPMPATGAGLIRFYSEADSPGIGIGPIATVLIPVIIMVIIVAAYLLA